MSAEHDENGEHITRRELTYTLRAMEWRLRWAILFAVVANVGLDKVGTGTFAAIGLGAAAVLGVASKFLHF